MRSRGDEEKSLLCSSPPHLPSKHWSLKFERLETIAQAGWVTDGAYRFFDIFVYFADGAKWQSAPLCDGCGGIAKCLAALGDDSFFGVSAVYLFRLVVCDDFTAVYVTRCEYIAVFGGVGCGGGSLAFLADDRAGCTQLDRRDYGRSLRIIYLTLGRFVYRGSAYDDDGFVVGDIVNGRTF